MYVLRHKARVWRDGQNYDPQDHASIAASRGKNHSASDTMNEYITASFILSLVEVGLTPYLLNRNM